MLGQLASNEDFVISDLEAGVGTLMRMERGNADIVLVVCEPSTKSIEVARRAAAIAADVGKVIVIANRVHDEADLEPIRAAVDGHELIVIPEDAAITAADEEGRAPIDETPDSPGVRALSELAGRLRGTDPRRHAKQR